MTIAVGIGANTALLSSFNRLVLHPIDLPDAGRIVRIWTNNKERKVVAPIMSVPKFECSARRRPASAADPSKQVSASGLLGAPLEHRTFRRSKLC